MSDGKLEAQWIHTSAQMMLLANCNAPKNKRFGPKDFPSPFAPAKRRKRRGVDVLKIFLGKESVNE